VANWLKRLLLPVLFASLSLTTSAQQLPSGGAGSNASAAGENDSLPIGPGDHITLHVLNVPDLDQPHLRVTDNGEIPLLLLGSIKISGLTPAAAAQRISAAYKAHNFLRDTQVQVTVEEYAASEVTVFGYVVGQSIASQTNGLAIPLSAPKPLLTVLSMAGGLSDRASRTVTIQRRDHSVKPFSIFLPNDPSESLVNDTIVYPGDIVMVPRSGIVYLLGNVGHPTGVYMNEDGKISLMEALSQGGSPLPTSALRNVMIFRKNSDQYTRLHVNLGKIIKGKEPDIALKPEDVIWVPFSYGKNLLVNGAAIVAAVSSATATGIVYTH
jgi:polysaccharide export outer membrane protein